VANSIYEPSYLSLEWALRYYNLIPEGVYQYTSCTTKKTQTFATVAGNFVYRSFVPRYYWGYDLHTIGRYATLRIASPEKTLCDYLYFHPELMTETDFEEMRINLFVREDIANNETLQRYASRYPKRLRKQLQTFLSFLQNRDV
jgi:predicted transcriptional regulator of viral defense system